MKHLSFILIFCLTSLDSTQIIAGEKHTIKPGESLFIPAEERFKEIEFNYNLGISRVILDGFQNEKITVRYKNSTAVVLNGSQHTTKKLVRSISLILPEKIEESSCMTLTSDAAHNDKAAVVIFPKAVVNNNLKLVPNAVAAILAKYKN